MLLQVIDIFLLEIFDHRRESEPLAEYQIVEYGEDYQERIDQLIHDGYLSLGTADDSLEMLTIPELKDILRSHNQKLSGKKNVLVQRIKDTIPLEDYRSSLYRIYVLTDKGKQELRQRAAYLENKHEGYGFLNAEIFAIEQEYAARGVYSSDNVITSVFQSRLKRQVKEKNYRQISHEYFSMSRFYKKHKNVSESLRYRLLSLYIDLTGMDDNNCVIPFKYQIDTLDSNVLRDIDNSLVALGITENDLGTVFQKAVNSCDIRPPFSYFSTDTMTQIIIESLRGYPNVMQKYSKYRNTPDTDNPDYLYTEWNPINDSTNHEINIILSAEKDEGTYQENGHISNSKTGCLPLIMLIVFLLYYCI